MKTIQRIYHPYTQWEDFNNGMYQTKVTDEEILIQKAVALLSNPDEFKETAKRVLNHWPVATAVNLTNNTCNKKAWIGQASCSYQYGTTELLTRTAWGRLNDTQRTAANQIAETLISHWLFQYSLNEYEKRQLAFDF